MSFIVLAAGSLGTLKVCLVCGMSSFLLLMCLECQSYCWLLLLTGGMLLLELNRLLRPGGYFVWSATPVYQKLPEDVEIWNGIGLTASLNLTQNKRSYDVTVSVHIKQAYHFTGTINIIDAVAITIHKVK
jgi:hypothetical protein